MASRAGNDSRRRRHYSIPLSPGRVSSEWIAILLLACPALGGMWWFGGVRIWLYGPLLIACMAGVCLFAGRLLIFRDIDRITVPAGIIPFGAFVAWTIAMIPFAAVPHEARVECLQFASVLLAYWAWQGLAGHGHRWRWILSALILSVTAMAWYALIQQAHESTLVLGIPRPPAYGMRASGAYFCPNHFANLMEIFFPICLALLFCSTGGFALRLICAYAIAVMLPALYLTQSRSGWIAFMAGTGVVVLLIGLRKSLKRMMMALLLLVIVFGAGAATLWSASPMVRERVRAAIAGDIRIDMWRDTVLIIKDSPWKGHGAGSFRWVFPHFNTYMKQYMDPEYSHNEYLQTLADHGVIGLLLVSAGFVAFFRKIFPLIRNPALEKEAYLAMGLIGAVVAFLIHAAFDYPFHIFANIHTLAAVAGISFAAMHEPGILTGLPLTLRNRWLVSTAMIVVALAVAVFMLQADIAHRLYRKAVNASDNYEYGAAESHYRAAILIDPGYWRPYLGMGDLLRRQSFWNRTPDDKHAQTMSAIQYYQEASRRNAWDSDPIYGIVKAYELAGDKAKSLSVLEELVQRVPRQAFYLVELGSALEEANRPADALAAFEKSQSIMPSEMAAWRMGELRKQLGSAQP